MRLQIVPARAGALWFRKGLRTFARQPLALGSLFFTFVIVITLPSIIPVVGLLIALALVPMGTVGMMAGAQEADAGHFPRPPTLFVALRQGARQTRNILTLGALYAAAVVAAIAASALIDGGQFARFYLGHSELTAELAQNPRFRTAMWTTIFFYLPISIGFWHAPALVHWHTIAPVKSIFFSLIAVVRNAGAFVVYVALWAALSVGVSVAAVLLASMAQAGAAIAWAIFVLPGLLIAAMFFTSIWFSFSDSFPLTEEAAR